MNYNTKGKGEIPWLGISVVRTPRFHRSGETMKRRRGGRKEETLIADRPGGHHHIK